MHVDSHHVLSPADKISVTKRPTRSGAIITFGVPGESDIRIAGSVAQMRELRDKLSEWLGPSIVVPAGEQAAKALVAVSEHSEGKVA